MKKKIYFRADAGASIGYGHFIRSLALADLLKDNFDCTFFTTNPTEYQLAEMYNICKYVELNEISALEDFLAVLDGSEIVVLDNYFYTEEYQKHVKDRGSKLVFIDDMHNMHYFADIIINITPLKNIMYDAESYTRIVMGRDWVPLRPEFFARKSELVKRNNDIIICLGGSDPYMITNKILKSLDTKMYHGFIHVIAGDKVQIDTTFKNKIIVHRNLSAFEMVKLFDRSALAIVACSMVQIEASTRGIPLLAGYYVDNQFEDYIYGIEHNMFVGLGNLLNYNGSNIFKLIIQAKNKKYQSDISGLKKRYIDLFKSLI